MIVRISTEGQYRLPDEDAQRLRELDDDAVSAIEADDEQRFQTIFDEMLELVRSDGDEIDDEELVESAVIIPPPDITFEEAKVEFSAEGLIPDDE